MCLFFEIKIFQIRRTFSLQYPVYGSSVGADPVQYLDFFTVSDKLVEFHLVSYFTLYLMVHSGTQFEQIELGTRSQFQHVSHKVCLSVSETLVMIHHVDEHDSARIIVCCHFYCNNSQPKR
jgi:hypothetical protein